MSNRSSKNNLVAGAFLLGSLALALGISFWLGEVSERLGSKAGYTVHFPMDVGVAGLQPGSKVMLAGMEVGRVERVRRVEQSGRVVAMEADVLVNDAVALHQDARAFLTQPILGGVSGINITSVGLTGAPLGEGGSIEGGVAPGLLAQVGLGPEQAEQIFAILDNIERATREADELAARMDNIAAAFETDAEGSATDIRQVLADLRAFTARFTGDNGWDTRIERILADAQSNMAEVQSLREGVAQTVANADGFVTDARAILGENRPGIAAIVQDGEAIVSRVRFETAVRFEELLDTGVLALASYSDLGGRLNQMVTREYPQIRRTLANVRETSDQAKLAMGELRSQPWRLLDAPTGQELEREPLYAAARAYAVAVADLRAASESLETAIGSAETRASSGENLPGAAELAGMARSVDEAFKRYQDAEQSLLERLASQQ
ncbi:MAG: MlaD family protein [Phycisphaerales bacterium JB040]